MAAYTRRNILRVGGLGAAAGLLVACGEALRVSPVAPAGLAVASAPLPELPGFAEAANEHAAETTAAEQPVEATVAEVVFNPTAGGVFPQVIKTTELAETESAHAEAESDHAETEVEHSETETAHAYAEISIAGTEFTFTPSVVELMAGEPARLTYANQGVVFHDLVVHDMPVTDVNSPAATATAGAAEPEEHAHGSHADEHSAEADAGVHLNVNPGQEAVIEFTPAQPGRYDFTCTVAGHAQGGMTGTLIVR